MRHVLLMPLFVAPGCIPHVGQHVGGLPRHEIVTATAPVDGVPRNIILVIGDGMGPAQVHAAATANGGHLSLEGFPITGLSRTASSDDWVTDSAAAATAMATGTKSYNGAIGVGPGGEVLPTLVEIAEASGRATGVVATSSITHATPAAFVAHVPSRADDDAIAVWFVTSGLDVAIGGGRGHFVGRSDGRDLVAEWAATGTVVVESVEALEGVPAPVAALAATGPLPPVGERGEAWLGDAAIAAAERLAADPDGFFLMVEGSQIDWGGHGNDATWMVAETLDLDRVVGRLLQWAAVDGETLVVVTADHETGGFAVMKGDPANGTLTGRFHTRHHTAVPVGVYAFGPGATRFAGVYENTGLFDRIEGLWAPSVDDILTTP